MFSSPFPESVAFVELDGLPNDSTVALSAEERNVLHPTASPKRVREFTLGRIAARIGLERLGIHTAQPILAGKRGEPLWPEGAVGSISHSDDHAVAAVGRSSDVRGIGVDLQSLRRGVDEAIARRICHPEEMSWCSQSQTELQVRLLALFSAKETLFKTLYPLSRAVFYFLDAELSWKADESRFEALLLKDLKGVFAAGSRYSVNFQTTGNMILTSMLL